jgi:hypothetical protein
MPDMGDTKYTQWLLQNKWREVVQEFVLSAKSLRLASFDTRFEIIRQTGEICENETYCAVSRYLRWCITIVCS